jgi:alkyl hydroperoxide reductase subunit D
MDAPITNETVVSLFNDLGIDVAHVSHSLNSMAGVNSRYLRDMKLNVSAVLASINLTRKEANLLALAVVVNEKVNVLISAFENLPAPR